MTPDDVGPVLAQIGVLVAAITIGVLAIEFRVEIWRGVRAVAHVLALIGGAIVDAVVARYHDRYVVDDDDEESESAVVPPVAAPPASDVAVIAKPQTSCNGPLRVAEDSAAVAERAKLAALAALITESRRKPFAQGQVPETRGLAILFGVSASSDPSSEYQRLRALLKAELARLDPPMAAPTFRDLDPGCIPAGLPKTAPAREPV
jgi:hypothetical protein